MEDIIYNKREHRYVLNPSCLNGHPYADEVKLQRALDEQSRNLYIWIYSQILKFNKNYAEYVLAKDEDYKDAIRGALKECYEADIKSGYMGIKKYAGNVENGTFTDESILIEKLIPVSAKQIIRNCGADINIFYAGFLPHLDRDRYERLDY